MILGISCNCLEGSKFVISFCQQWCQHFVHHYRFLAHCLEKVSGSAAIISTIEKFDETKNQICACHWAQCPLSSSEEPHPNHDIVSKVKICTTSMQSFITGFAMDLVKHNMNIIHCVSYYAENSIGALASYLQLTLFEKRTISIDETEVKDTNIPVSTDETENPSQQRIINNIKRIPMESVTIIQQFGKDLILHHKHISEVFGWSVHQLFGGCYFVLILKRHLIVDATFSAVRCMLKFVASFSVDLFQHISLMLKFCILVIRKIYELQLMFASIILRIQQTEEESITVPSHTTEDVRVAANEDQTDHFIITDARTEIEYTPNEINIIDTIDDYTDRWYTEKEVPGQFNEDLYDSVKEAVQESAQTVVSSMEKSVMSFTRTAIDPAPTEDNQHETDSVADEGSHPTDLGKRPLSRASMSARLDMLSESPPPSPTVDDSMASEDGLMPLIGSAHRRRIRSRTQTFKSTSSETDETDKDKPTSSTGITRALLTEDQNQALILEDSTTVQEVSITRTLLTEDQNQESIPDDSTTVQEAGMHTKRTGFDNDIALACFQKDHLMSEASFKSSLDEGKDHLSQVTGSQSTDVDESDFGYTLKKQTSSEGIFSLPKDANPTSKPLQVVINWPCDNENINGIQPVVSNKNEKEYAQQPIKNVIRSYSDDDFLITAAEENDDRVAGRPSPIEESYRHDVISTKQYDAEMSSKTSSHQFETESQDRLSPINIPTKSISNSESDNEFDVKSVICMESTPSNNIPTVVERKLDPNEKNSSRTENTLPSCKIDNIRANKSRSKELLPSSISPELSVESEMTLETEANQPEDSTVSDQIFKMSSTYNLDEHLKIGAGAALNARVECSPPVASEKDNIEIAEDQDDSESYFSEDEIDFSDDEIEEHDDDVEVTELKLSDATKRLFEANPIHYTPECDSQSAISPLYANSDSIPSPDEANVQTGFPIGVISNQINVEHDPHLGDDYDDSQYSDHDQISTNEETSLTQERSSNIVTHSIHHECETLEDNFTSNTENRENCTDHHTPAHPYHKPPDIKLVEDTKGKGHEDKEKCQNTYHPNGYDFKLQENETILNNNSQPEDSTQFENVSSQLSAKLNSDIKTTGVGESVHDKITASLSIPNSTLAGVINTSGTVSCIDNNFDLDNGSDSKPERPPRKIKTDHKEIFDKENNCKLESYKTLQSDTTLTVDSFTDPMVKEGANTDLDALDINSELDFDDELDEEDEEYTRTVFPPPSPIVSSTKGLPSYLLRRRLESFTKHQNDSSMDDEVFEETSARTNEFPLRSTSSSSNFWKDPYFNPKSPRPSSPHPSLQKYKKTSIIKTQKERGERPSIKRSASVSLDKAMRGKDSRQYRYLNNLV